MKLKLFLCYLAIIFSIDYAMAQASSTGGTSCSINRQCGSCSVSCPVTYAAICLPGVYERNWGVGGGRCISNASCSCRKLVGQNSDAAGLDYLVSVDKSVESGSISMTSME